MNDFHTRLCDLLDIKYPIIQGAMAKVAGPRLAAAVSNAGGLGVLATWGISVDELRRNINQVRDLTDKPFAVNIIPIGPAFALTRAEATIAEGVKIITTGRADPRAQLVSLLKSHGVTVLGVVPTVKLALRLEQEGVDAVIASGSEAGGHVGTVATLALVPQVIDAVKVPVAAAGGIGDARSFVAALALGACGIQMGTRFIATYESEATGSQKESILRSSEEDTIITDIFTGRTARYIRCAEIDQWQQLKKEGASDEVLRQYLCEIRRRKKLLLPDFAGVASGQVCGMIKSIKSADEIIIEIIDGAKKICHDLGIFAF